MKYTIGNNKKDTVHIRIVEGTMDELVLLENKTRELHIGTEREVMTRRKLVLLARRIIVAAHQRKIEKIALDFNDFKFSHLDIAHADIAEIVAVNFEMANLHFTEFKTAPLSGWDTVEEVRLVNVKKSDLKHFDRGRIIGEEVNRCRRLANLPGGEVVPQTLADEARKVAKGMNIDVKVLDEKQMEKLGMGGVLGVGKGSSESSKFIVMEYFSGKEDDAPIVLVGKGVTFDTGGINLKPSDSVLGMNMDMSGGAAVIHAIALAARLGLKKNIVALIPAVENMPSGSSYRPGDILRSMSGKTIEVLNTDAEGRIILADALTYAKRYNPRLVVDVATLTGAAAVALGERASAIFTKESDLEKYFREWGELSGDYVWPLPLWEEYEEDIRGTFGDWANTGRNRYGGAITAAVFLAQFAEGYPWVHLDIAPRMTAIEGEYLAKGAAGASVRLLIKMLEEF